MKTILPAMLAFLAAVCCWSCSPGFDDPREVIDLRFLGAQTDPPEYLYPKYGAPTRKAYKTTLRFLLADPVNPDAPIDWTVTSCPLKTELLCPAGKEIMLAQGTSKPGVTEVPVTIGLQLVKDSFKVERYGGLFGAAVWLQVHAVNVDGDEVRMLKSLVFRPKASRSSVPNSNPEFAEIQILDDADAVLGLAELKDGFWAVAPGVRYRLNPIFTDGSREQFRTLAAEISPEGSNMPRIIVIDLDEKLTVRYQSDLGSLSANDKTEVPIPGIEDPDKVKDLSVEFTAPAEGTGTIWMVADDGRGGLGWYILPFKVEVSGK